MAVLYLKKNSVASSNTRANQQRRHRFEMSKEVEQRLREVVKRAKQKRRIKKKELLEYIENQAHYLKRNSKFLENPSLLETLIERKTVLYLKGRLNLEKDLDTKILKYEYSGTVPLFSDSSDPAATLQVNFVHVPLKFKCRARGQYLSEFGKPKLHEPEKFFDMIKEASGVDCAAVYYHTTKKSRDKTCKSNKFLIGESDWYKEIMRYGTVANWLGQQEVVGPPWDAWAHIEYEVSVCVLKLVIKGSEEPAPEEEKDEEGVDKVLSQYFESLKSIQLYNAKLKSTAGALRKHGNLLVCNQNTQEVEQLVKSFELDATFGATFDTTFAVKKLTINCTLDVHQRASGIYYDVFSAPKATDIEKNIYTAIKGISRVNTLIHKVATGKSFPSTVWKTLAIISLTTKKALWLQEILQGETVRVALEKAPVGGPPGDCKRQATVNVEFLLLTLEKSPAITDVTQPSAQ